MNKQRDLKKGLYFLHGYYTRGNSDFYQEEIYRDQMILMKDSIDDIYDVDAYDINVREMRLENQIPQGEFVYFNGETLDLAENNPTATVYTELNKDLVNLIGYLNYGNQPEELTGNVKEVYSYHINVGHGNCSIIVFNESGKWNMWMVDCSVFDFTDKKRHHKKLDDCMYQIQEEFGVNKISKLMITHLHYDHINGIEYLIKQNWIDSNTEVWMNIQYPWKQPTYSRILLQLKALGVKFIDPIIGNSTKHIKILYPSVSFNTKNAAPQKNINNASVLYQICLGDIRMLFTGDIETEGWGYVLECVPRLSETIYYCISHHGSITGHIRNGCIPLGRSVRTLADCASISWVQILMGRNNAYSGIYSGRVLADFNNIVKTEDAEQYVELEWNTGKVSYI